MENQNASDNNSFAVLDTSISSNLNETESNWVRNPSKHLEQSSPMEIDSNNTDNNGCQLWTENYIPFDIDSFLSSDLELSAFQLEKNSFELLSSSGREESEISEPMSISPTKVEPADSVAKFLYQDSSDCFGECMQPANSQHISTSSGMDFSEFNEFAPSAITALNCSCAHCGILLSNCISDSTILCDYCGDEVLVREQKEHDCIVNGQAMPLCSTCGNNTSEPKINLTSASLSNISSKNLTKSSNCAISSKHVRKRGRKARCAKCGLECASAVEKRLHIATEHSRDFKCEQCGALLRSEENLRRHKMCHNGNARHKCLRCAAKFNHQRSLRVHESMCGVKKKKKTGGLQGIKKDSGEKRYGCGLCGEKFSVKPSVSRHMRIVHMGQKPHKCTTCGKKFTSKYNRDVHFMKTHQK